MAKTSWYEGGGTDSLGFNAMADGLALTAPFQYEEAQSEAVFWSTTINSGSNSPYLLIIQHIAVNGSTLPPTAELGPFAISYASVRFVKDN